MGFFSRGKNDGITEELVLRALGTVQEPELGGDLVSRKMIKDLKVADGRVSFTVELTTPACPLKDQIQQECEAALQKIAGVPKEHVQIEWSASVRPRGGILDKAAIPGVSHVIAVAAGKGGVGKSTAAVNLAVALAQEGARVGLLDADIHGPSVPLMMGTKGRQPEATQMPNGQPRFFPIEAYGIKMMSVGFLIDDRQPVIWRGPMVSQLLRQFLYNVEWAPLDYLVIDMPPGTGDIALTLTQSLQNVGLTGVVTVTTPQEVATLDVIKSMEMFRKVNVPLLGIIENMAYFIAPDTGNRYDIFGTGGAARLAAQVGVPLLAQIPLGISVREGGDTGRPAVTSDMPDAYAEMFREAARQLAARVSRMEYGKEA